MHVSVPMCTDSYRHARDWEVAAPGNAAPVRQFKLMN